jgi:hypothetical protein
MSQVKTVSAKKTTIFSAIASFAGMMAAVPVSLAIFSAAQPAHAMQMPTAKDASYAQYAQAYTQGYLASTDGQTTGGCSEPQSTQATDNTAPAEVTAATAKPHVMLVKANKNTAQLSKEEWTKNVTNSYNNFVTTNNTKTEVITKNSNNTIGSNNTSSSSVTVKDSNGAVVSNNTSAVGNNHSDTDVHNFASNNTTTNTAIINDSFNKDSHDKTVIVKDSGNTTNTTTTNNTAIVNDSFNKDNHSLNIVDSGNKVEDNSTHTHVDVKLENHA